MGELAGAPVALQQRAGQTGDSELVTAFPKQLQLFWRTSVSKGSKGAGLDF